MSLKTLKSSELPWYQEGLRFECTGCGKCCSGPSGYVWVSEGEMQAMANHLNLTLDQFKRKYTRQKDNRYSLTERKTLQGDFDCVFLKDKKCEVYPARPKQCQTYPWWPQNLNSEESWNLAAETCEGISAKAPLVPIEKIQSDQ